MPSKIIQDQKKDKTGLKKTTLQNHINQTIHDEKHCTRIENSQNKKIQELTRPYKYTYAYQFQIPDSIPHGFQNFEKLRFRSII